MRSRPCSTVFNKLLNNDNVAGVLVNIPDWSEGCDRDLCIMAMYPHFIQHSPCPRVLRKSVRWHEALVATLQGGLRIHRHRRTALCYRFALLQDVMARELLRCEGKTHSLRAVQFNATVKAKLMSLFLCEFLRQNRLTHLLGWQSRCFVLQRLSATEQSGFKILKQVVQHCRILVSKQLHDSMLAHFRYSIFLAMPMLEATPLRLERLKLCSATPYPPRLGMPVDAKLSSRSL